MARSDGLFVIGEREGFAREVGVLVSMLENARHFLLGAVRDLETERLDARPGAATNTIGSLLAHLHAAENLFQRLTFEGRMFNKEEKARYWPAFGLEGSDRPKGRALASYLDALADTRDRTLAGMHDRDDAWLKESKTFARRPANTHYYWLHYLQDEARHTGQIILIRKHLIEGAERGFDPYVF